MKTPKEKAEDLVNKYDETLTYLESKTKAKQCAIIAVNEILQAIDWHEFETPNKEIEYWNQVKHEIENL